jgi:hypothetical protein
MRDMVKEGVFFGLERKQHTPAHHRLENDKKTNDSSFEKEILFIEKTLGAWIDGSAWGDGERGVSVRDNDYEYE